MGIFSLYLKSKREDVIHDSPGIKRDTVLCESLSNPGPSDEDGCAGEEEDTEGDC